MDASKATLTSIDQYIALFPEDIQALLTQMRETIRAAAPEAIEKISYQMPAFYYHGNLVYFAAFKHHIGFYPTASGTAAFQAELAGYKTSKGAIQFPLNQPLPLDLVRRIVAFRVSESAGKAAAVKGANGRSRTKRIPQTDIG